MAGPLPSLGWLALVFLELSLPLLTWPGVGPSLLEDYLAPLPPGLDPIHSYLFHLGGYSRKEKPFLPLSFAVMESHEGQDPLLILECPSFPSSGCHHTEKQQQKITAGHGSKGTGWPGGGKGLI